MFLFCLAVLLASFTMYAYCVCKIFHRLSCNASCRGCGETPLTNAKPTHIALTADVYAAVCKVREKYPQAPVFVVGFSIGAYTLTKYVGEADSGVWPEGQLQAYDLLVHW